MRKNEASSFLDELVSVLLRRLSKFSGNIVLANLCLLFGVMIAPSGERGERISLVNIVAAWLASPGPNQRSGESEAVDHSSTGVWGMQDKCDVHVEALEVVLAWVLSDLDSSDEAILDLVPSLPDLEKSLKFRSSVFERPNLRSG